MTKSHLAPIAPHAGFTLLEICIALGLVSILSMALIEMNTLTSMSMQSNAATDEFNQEASLLLNLLDSTGSVTGITNGCTATFRGMNIDGATGLPVISVATVPSPSPLAAFTTAMAVATAPIAIYTQPTTIPNNPQGMILQVTSPSALTANAFFPPPKNHLWVTNLAFTQVVDTGFLTPPLDNPLWVANLYDLNLSAQKVSSNGQTILGGATAYVKDFLVTLWISGGQVQYCGPNPS